MRQERLILRLAHSGGVSLAMEENEAADPIRVCLLGADAVATHSDRVTHLLEKARSTRPYGQALV